MRRARGAGDPVTEMAIVDTFTKLIFGEDEDYSDRELLIIQAFRTVDINVLRDTHREMGEYLRNMGVREMIHLVSRLREHMRDGLEILAPDSSRGTSAHRPGGKGHTFT